VGGNLTRARETSLTVTVLGRVRRGRALRRSGARPGDRILVTGSFGGAGLALARSERAGAPLRRVPVPRLAAGRALASLPGVGGCIDVSDGLAADLRHLLAASGVGARVEASRVPRPAGFARACAALGLDPERTALHSGEDYELVFTVRPGAPGPAALSRRLGVAVTEIGVVAPRRHGVKGLPPGGWRHFGSGIPLPDPGVPPARRGQAGSPAGR
jgi:thiamine-monophosphate kinase